MFSKIFSESSKLESLLLGYADNIERASTEFSTFINNFDPARVNEWANKIKDFEHACDNVTHETMNWLQGTFIVNYDREDIHELASDVDDIMDLMDASATRIELYRFTSMIPPVVELSVQLDLACKESAKILRILSKGKIDKSAIEICKGIKKFEENGDKIYHKALADLFTNSNDALSVLKWKEIIEEVEGALDKCNEVANDVEGIILKYS